MNLLDIIIVLLLLIGAIRGFFNGFISELASLLSLIIGIWAAFHYADDMFNFLSRFIENPGQGTQLLAYVLVFVGVALIMLLISRLLTRLAGMLALGLLNRILGLIFGAAKGLLLFLILAFLLKPIITSQWLKEYPLLQESRLLPHLLEHTDLIGNYLQLPEEPAAESETEYKTI